MLPKGEWPKWYECLWYFLSPPTHNFVNVLSFHITKTWYQISYPSITIAGVGLVAGVVSATAPVALGRESIDILWGSNSWRWRIMKVRILKSTTIKQSNIPEVQIQKFETSLQWCDTKILIQTDEFLFSLKKKSCNIVGVYDKLLPLF